jgi:hypothetical protein
MAGDLKKLPRRSVDYNHRANLFYDIFNKVFAYYEKQAHSARVPLIRKRYQSRRDHP